LCGLFNDVLNIEIIASDGMMTDELKTIWKEAVVAKTRYYLSIFVDGL
jgi:hypothetical protein